MAKSIKPVLGARVGSFFDPKRHFRVEDLRTVMAEEQEQAAPMEVTPAEPVKLDLNSALEQV